MTTIAELYQHYETLDAAKDKAGQNVVEYRAIIAGAKSGPNEKRLASQFIVKFHKFFPQLKEEVLTVLLEMCESTDVSIRRQAVKDIETLCRDSPELCQRTADTLTQLLQTQDATELTLVQKSLMTLLRTNAMSTLAGVFQQIVEGEELVRERAISFLSIKMKLLIAEEVLPKNVEEQLLAHCRKVLEDVSGTEFVLIMRLLTTLPSMNTLLGRQQLLDIVTEQAELNHQFQPSEPDSVERLVQCVKEAMPLFSKNVHSGRFVEYLCAQVLPSLGLVDDASALDLLRLLAEMVIHCGELEDASARRCVAGVYARLVEYMPLPSAAEEGGKEGGGAEEVGGSVEEPKLQFSYVECLMFTFHQLARKCPDFLTADVNAERLKDFRLRLQYFARGVQGYIKTLRTTLQGKTDAALKADSENRIRALALKTTSNINALIKDLFYNPPAYKATVTLSFKPTVASAPKSPDAPPGGTAKRSGFTPVTFGEEPASKKAAKDDKKVYAPPGGKFSAKVGQFPADQGGVAGRGEGGNNRRGARGGGRGGRGYGRW